MENKTVVFVGEIHIPVHSILNLLHLLDLILVNFDICVFDIFASLQNSATEVQFCYSRQSQKILNLCFLSSHPVLHSFLFELISVKTSAVSIRMCIFFYAQTGAESTRLLQINK